jgi:hypothetical protein
MRSMAGLIALAVIVVACSSSDTTDDYAQACNAVSANGLATEETPAGTCPTSPRTLTGTVPAYSACSQSTDCAPFCCQCAGSGTSADVAQCSGGNCLDGATTCCLYSQQCQ